VNVRVKFPCQAISACLGTFDFNARSLLNKALVPEQVRREWIEKRQDRIAAGPFGTGSTHTGLVRGPVASGLNPLIGWVLNGQT
jgi:hypothetical protein